MWDLLLPCPGVLPPASGQGLQLTPLKPGKPGAWSSRGAATEESTCRSREPQANDGQGQQEPSGQKWIRTGLQLRTLSFPWGSTLETQALLLVVEML